MKTNYVQNVNSVVPAPTQQYPNRQFHLQSVLGEGGEGGVYLAKQKNGDPLVESVAIKLQPRLKEYEQKLLEILINYQSKDETEYPSYIIKIYEIFVWNNFTAIIMETGTQDLYEYMKKEHKADNWIQKGDICKQLLKSLQFLHHIGYAHRDIKPENYILVGNQWKLCDFGLAKSHEGQRLQTKHIGSIMYTAPEVLKGDQDAYTEKVDVWSLGCVFYEILSGSQLFAGKSQGEIQRAILDSDKLIKDSCTYMQIKVNEIPQASVNWRNALIKMLQYNPVQRPSIKEVVEEFFSQQIVFSNTQSQRQQPLHIQKDINPNFASLKYNLNQFQQDLLEPTSQKLKEKANQIQQEAQAKSLYQTDPTFSKYKPQLFQQQNNNQFNSQKASMVMEQNLSHSSQNPNFIPQNRNFNQIQQKKDTQFLPNSQDKQYSEKQVNDFIQREKQQKEMKLQEQQLNKQEESNVVLNTQKGDQQKEQGQTSDQIKFDMIERKFQEKDQEIRKILKRLGDLEDMIAKQNIQNQQDLQFNNKEIEQLPQLEQEDNLTQGDQISSLQFEKFVKAYNSKIEDLLGKGSDISNLNPEQKLEIKSNLILIQKLTENLNNLIQYFQE